MNAEFMDTSNQGLLKILFGFTTLSYEIYFSIRHLWSMSIFDYVNSGTEWALPMKKRALFGIIRT